MMSRFIKTVFPWTSAYCDMWTRGQVEKMKILMTGTNPRRRCATKIEFACVAIGRESGSHTVEQVSNFYRHQSDDRRRRMRMFDRAHIHMKPRGQSRAVLSKRFAQESLLAAAHTTSAKDRRL